MQSKQTLFANLRPHVAFMDNLYVRLVVTITIKATVGYVFLEHF